MVNKYLLKIIFVSIFKNFKKFLSIVCIILLGVGFYVGMNSSTPDMRKTVSNFYSRNNLYDYQVFSDIGITKDELKQLKTSVPAIEETEGGYRNDVIMNLSNSEVVVSILDYNKDAKLNKIELIDGKFPSSIHECVVEQAIINLGYKIGDTIYLNDSNFKDTDVTISGVVRSPFYISNNRGNTNLLSGKVSYYIYVHSDNFKFDNYIYGYIKLKNTATAFTPKYTKHIDSTKDKIEKVSIDLFKKRLGSIVETSEKDYNKAQAEYDKNYNKALNDLKNAESQIKDAQTQINNGYSKLMSESEINAYLAKSKQQLDTAKKQLDEAKKQLDQLKSAYNKSLGSINVDKLKDEKATLEKNITTSQNNITNYNNKIADLNKQYYELDLTPQCTTVWGFLKNCSVPIIIRDKARKITNEILEYERKVAAEKLNITSYQTKIAAIDVQLKAAEYPANIKEAESKYNTMASSYNTNLQKYNQAKNSMVTEMKTARSNLDKQKALLETKKKELSAEKTKVQKELDKAKQDIADYRDQLDQLRNSKWNVFTRNDNAGYSQYASDIQAVNNLSKIFPIVFFIVAGLVTLTSLSRMVESERTQSGTLLALGYSRKQVIYKYVLYTFFAVLIGSIIGIALGISIIPTIVYKVYSIIYTLPKLELQFNLFYMIIAFGLAVLSTVVTTYFVAKKTVNQVPYKIMRPKPPKLGRKTILEYIPRLWNRIKFINKVTIRNLFRYKKRFFMTVIGVAGCSALILAALGLKSSIVNIISLQYGKLFDLDVQLFFKDDITRDAITTEVTNIKKLNSVKNAVSLRYEIVTVKIKNKTYDISLLATNNQDEFDKVIKLLEVKNNNKIKLSDNGVVINEKIADLLKVTIGDKITFTNSNGDIQEATVDNICTNYVNHYVYMTSNYYEKLNKVLPRNNMLIVKSKQAYKENDFARELNKNKLFSNMTFVSTAQDVCDKLTKNLNMLIIVIIVSAGLLAFIVLFNLAVLNIGERKRELATLKVLGFNEKEVCEYIKKEMRILTAIGIVVGLIAGYYLTGIIIKTCEIDTLMFDRRIHYVNFVWSTLATLVFSYIVNFSINKEIKKIDMIESLKSIE